MHIWLYVALLALALLALAATLLMAASFQAQAERERQELEDAYRRQLEASLAAWNEVERTYPSGSKTISDEDWQAFQQAVDAYGQAARAQAAVAVPPDYEAFQAHLVETMNVCHEVLNLLPSVKDNAFLAFAASATILEKANHCGIMRDRLDWESLTVR